MRTVLAALLVLSACGGSPAPAPVAPAPPPAAAPVTQAPAAATPCAPVVERLTTSMAMQMQQSLPADKAKKWTARLSDVLAASCAEDGWPEAVKACVVTAKTDEEVNACGDGAKGDAELQAKMMARMQPLMNEMMQDMGAGGGAPPDEDDPGTVVPPRP